MAQLIVLELIFGFIVVLLFGIARTTQEFTGGNSPTDHRGAN